MKKYILNPLYFIIKLAFVIAFGFIITISVVILAILSWSWKPISYSEKILQSVLDS